MEQIRMCLNCGCNLEYEDDYCECCNYRPPTNKITLILERANGVNVVVEKTRLKKQLSPFRYPGGKSKLIDYLYTHINQNKKKLISPFSGGASFELSLLESGVVDTLHINDMDYFIFAFWKQVKDNHRKLCENILKFEVNHNNVQAAKDIITSGVEVGIEEAATMAIVANRMSYSGIYKAGLMGGKNGSVDKLTQRYAVDSIIKKIERIAAFSERIKVTRVDAYELVEESYWDEECTLFLDPPYVKKAEGIYNKYYTLENHIALARLIDGMYEEFDGADIILTYDEDPIFDRYGLYNGACVDIVSRKYSI